MTSVFNPSRGVADSRFLTNTQTAVKINVIEYDGDKPGRHEMIIPSQYQFLNVWNFSVFRVTLKDRAGRILGEVGQKSLNFFNAQIGAPSTDVPLIVEWDADYGIGEYQALDIVGSYFKIVASDVPLLNPTDLLASLLSVKQGDNMQSIVNEGIDIKNPVYPWNRFSFHDIQNIYSLHYDNTFANGAPAYYNLPSFFTDVLPSDTSVFSNASNIVLEAEKNKTRYEFIGAFGYIPWLMAKHISCNYTLMDLQDNESRLQYFLSMTDLINRIIEIIKFDFPVSNYAADLRNIGPGLPDCYQTNPNWFEVGEFDFGDHLNQIDNGYNNNIRLNNQANGVYGSCFSGFQYGNLYKFNDVYNLLVNGLNPSGSKNIFGAIWVGDYYLNKLSLKNVPYMCFALPYTSDTGSDMGSCLKVVFDQYDQKQFYQLALNVDDKEKHTFNPVDVIGLENFTNWYINGDPVPLSFDNEYFVNILSLRLLNFFHKLEIDWFARYVQNEIHWMPQTCLQSNAVADLQTNFTTVYNTAGNIITKLIIYYGVDRFDFFQDVINQGSTTRTYLGSFYNRTNKKSVILQIRDALASIFTDHHNNRVGGCIQIYNNDRSGNPSLYQTLVNPADICQIDFIRPGTQIHVWGDNISGVTSTVVSGSIFRTNGLEIRGSDYYRAGY